MHVVAVERGGGRDGDRLLAGALHVEAGLPLALGAVHAVIEDADGDHVAEHLAQRVGVELRVPRADGLVILAVRLVRVHDRQLPAWSLSPLFE